jgi:hypothetical protein
MNFHLLTAFAHLASLRPARATVRMSDAAYASRASRHGKENPQLPQLAPYIW